MSQRMGRMHAILGGVCLSVLAASAVSAAPLFESNFDGASGNIPDLPQWSTAWNTRLENTATVVGDAGQLLIEGGMTGGLAKGWHYLGMRADSAQGTAMLFNPDTAAGLRFEAQINYMGDQYTHTASRTNLNTAFRFYLSPTNYTVNPQNQLGQRIAAEVTYNRNSRTAVGTAPTFDLALSVVNKTGGTGEVAYDVGVKVYAVTLSGMDMDKLTAAERDNLKIALEIRNQNGGEIRMGYQKITVTSGASTAGDWVYSAWLNPANTGLTNGTDPSVNLPTNWMGNFANSTRWYLDANVNPETKGVVQFDNVQANAIPEPAALGALSLGGLLGLMRRR